MSILERFIFVFISLIIMIGAGHLPQDTKSTQEVYQNAPPQKSTQIDINEVFNGKPIKSFSKHQEKCLADNIYYEASNQPYEGKLGVAFVTMNRLADVNYPNSICGVVYEKRHPTICQFSWVCNPPTRFNQKSWEECLAIAQSVINFVTLGIGDLTDPTHGALFFHATYVSPTWRNSFHQTVQIADHIFYRKSNLNYNL